MTRLVLVLSLGLWSSLLPAQIRLGPVDPRDPRNQPGQEDLWARERQQELERQQRILERTFPYSTVPRNVPLPYQLGFRRGLSDMFPRYEGLPTYPENVPGFGGYPGAGLKTDRGGRMVMPLRAPVVPEDRWPSWIEEGSGAKGLRATAQEAVLIRATDRVWYLAADEEAFVPLAFYDRFRFMRAGSRVDVRGKGEYQISFHDGALLRSRGPCSLVVVGLDEAGATLSFANLGQLWLDAKTRPLKVTLPDQTTFSFSGSLLHVRRRGDSCLVANEGVGEVEFEGAMGQGRLTGPTYLTLWMQPQKGLHLGASLQLEGAVRATEEGTTLRLQGGEGGGAVTWSGARFQVAAGSVLELEPLLGTSFPQKGVGPDG